ncbi:MAG: tetratricopeptide repeat protein [Chitinophagales bacterium]
MATEATRLQAEAPTSAHNNKQLNKLLQLAEWYATIQPQKAVLQAEEALKIAIQKKDKASECKLVYLLGVMYSNQGRFEIAIDYFHKAIEISEENANTTILAKAFNAIGNLHKLKRDYKTGLEHYFNALECDVKSFNAIVYNNIAEVYAFLDKYDEAIEYLQKEEKMIQTQSEPKLWVNCLMNTGRNHYLQGNYQEAIGYFYEALEVANQYSDFTKQKVKCWYHIGAAHEYLEKDILALENYTRALEISRNHAYHLDTCIQLCKIGQLQLKQKSYEKALEYFVQCLEVIQEYSFESQRMDCLKGMYECYEILQDYTKANHFLKTIIQIQDRHHLAMGRVS